jgi:hypothetical protein
LDTGTEDKFPAPVYGKAPPDVKISPGTALSRYAQDLYMLDSKRVRAQEMHAIFGEASAVIPETQVGRSRRAPGDSNMSCRDTIHLICWYLEGKLSPSVEDEIEKHLRDCPDCHLVLDAANTTLDRYFGPARTEETPADIKAA